MPLSADDQRRYDNLDALNRRVAAGIAARQSGTPAAPAQPAIARPQELQPYINDTGFRGSRDLGGGFVGAKTDAQAAQAMRDRATQSQYAAQNIASMNAGADALRDLRATRLGISRGVLDQMEGRAENRAAPASGIAGSGSFDPFARPGDSYGDSQMRAQNYESFMKRAATDTGITAKQREALIGGAQGLMAPGALIGEQDQAAAGLASNERIAGANQQAGIARATLDAQAEMARQQADRQNQDRRFGLDIARFNLDAATKKPALTPYETTLQQEQAKTKVDRENAQRTGVIDLQDTLGKIEKLTEMADTSGTMNTIMAWAGTPFNTERSSQAEEFKAMSNGLAAALIKQHGPNPSNADLKAVQEQVSGLGKTPEGNRRILANMRQFALQRAVSNGVDIRPLVERRGAALAAQGMPQEQIVQTLREEFAGGY